MQSLLAPFKSLRSHLSRSRKNSTGENFVEKTRLPGLYNSGSGPFLYPSRSGKDCIEYGEVHVFGKSAVKVACVTKPAAVVRSSSLMREFGRSSRNEKSERNKDFHESVREPTDIYP